MLIYDCFILTNTKPEKELKEDNLITVPAFAQLLENNFFN
jgi:hypothetical protein